MGASSEMRMCSLIPICGCLLRVSAAHFQWSARCAAGVLRKAHLVDGGLMSFPLRSELDGGVPGGVLMEAWRSRGKVVMAPRLSVRIGRVQGGV